MNNSELKLEADKLMSVAGLPALLSSYADWFVGGSYAYDLMCWRDLDVYVLDEEHNLRQCFEVGYEMTQRLAARKSRFTNNVGGEPNGFYWGIKLGDERQGAWKIDLWFLDLPSYEQHANYVTVMRQRLTAENRSTIIEIKQAYWQRREYRDTITSDMIYRAALDDGVRTIPEFDQFLAGSAQSKRH